MSPVERQRTTTRRRHLAGSAALSCALLVAAGVARATEPPLPHSANAAVAQLCEALGRSENAAQQLELVAQLAQTKHAAAGTCLAHALSEGQADAVADRMLEALADLPAPAATELLVQLTHHRRAQARARAYLALAHSQGRAAAQWLEQGLHDGDAGVRTIAARALGEQGAVSALDALLRALGRGEAEAATAIGKLGDAASLPRFDAYLGRQPLRIMLAGYQAYLERADLERASKLRIVATLEDVTGEPVRAFMQSLLARPGIASDPELVRALRASMARLRPAAKAAPRPEPKP